MPSNIPRARAVLEEILTWEIEDHLRDSVREALDLMTRAPAVRYARSKMPTITDEQKLSMRALSRDRSMSMAEIAIAVGLPASAQGRVSEVLNGLR